MAFIDVKISNTPPRAELHDAAAPGHHGLGGCDRRRDPEPRVPARHPEGGARQPRQHARAHQPARQAAAHGGGHGHGGGHHGLHHPAPVLSSSHEGKDIQGFLIWRAML